MSLELVCYCLYMCIYVLCVLLELRDGRDFDVVSVDDWNELVSVYSGGPQINAITIKTSFSMMIDLQPQTFTFHFKNDATSKTKPEDMIYTSSQAPVSITLSRYYDDAVLIAQICQKLQLKKSHFVKFYANGSQPKEITLSKLATLLPVLNGTTDILVEILPLSRSAEGLSVSDYLVDDADQAFKGLAKQNSQHYKHVAETTGSAKDALLYNLNASQRTFDPLNTLNSYLPSVGKEVKVDPVPIAPLEQTEKSAPVVPRAENGTSPTPSLTPPRDSSPPVKRHPTPPMSHRHRQPYDTVMAYEDHRSHMDNPYMNAPHSENRYVPVSEEEQVSIALALSRADEPPSPTSASYPPPQKSRSRTPADRAQFPGCVGLMNIGNTCYMNSALQCLLNTVPLVSYFLSYKYFLDLNPENILGAHGKVAGAFSALTQAYWNQSMKTIRPSYFKQVIGQQFDQFSGFNQQDSQELLSCVLDALVCVLSVSAHTFYLSQLSFLPSLLSMKISTE